MKQLTFLLPVMLVGISACSSIPDSTKELLDKPVDCATADEDIAALDAATPNTGERAVAGVRSLLPVAIATGVITRDYRDRASVAVGKLERDIDNKIADIYEACAQGSEEGSDS